MEQYQDLEKLADEYYAEGKQTFFENRMNEAALLIQNAIQLYKQCGNYEKYTTALNHMGVIYASSGNEAVAMDYYLEGLECAIEYGCDNIVTLFYNNIGSRYQELGEHEKAIEFFAKATKALEHPECVKEPRHDSWTMVTYLNMVLSYRNLGQYDLAKKYLKLAEDYLNDEDRELYKYSFLILKCQLCWHVGETQYIYEHMDELLESGEKNSNTSDYVQDMQDLCNLLKEMKEYTYWKKIILDFEKYAKEQKTVYFELILTEMWMEYYREVNEIQKYERLCVDYVKLHHMQKEILDKESVAAIDIKIQLMKKEMERRRATELSETDALTGLGNRYRLAQDAGELIKTAYEKQKKIGVGVLDIDFFKQHNDTYGHIMGDKCIRVVADVLQESVGDNGKVYRFGGDEFIILFAKGEKAQIRKTAERILNKLKAANIENIHSGVVPRVTISQGYACFVPDKAEDKDTLIEHADRALYYVKKNGRNAYHIIEE